MRREFLQKHWEVMEAFKNGAEVQFQDLSGVWMECEHPTFADNIEFRIKPAKRLPTIEEVEQWYLENRVFIYKEKTILHRMQSFDRCNRDGQLLQIGSVWITVKDFCELYTHLDGLDLTITEN